MAVDDGNERLGHVGHRIDGVEFARLDERADGRPVLGSSVVARKQCVLPVQGNRPDGPLDAVVVDLDAAVGQEELETIPVFGDVGQSLAERERNYPLESSLGEERGKPASVYPAKRCTKQFSKGLRRRCIAYVSPLRARAAGIVT